MDYYFIECIVLFVLWMSQRNIISTINNSTISNSEENGSEFIEIILKSFLNTYFPTNSEWTVVLLSSDNQVNLKEVFYGS